MISTADPPRQCRTKGVSVRYYRTVDEPQASGYVDAESSTSSRLVLRTDDLELLIYGESNVISVDVSVENRTTPVNVDEEREIELFLEKVCILSESGKDRSALDVLFQHINQLLIGGNFQLCDKILMAVDVERLSSTLMVGFLSITRDAKDGLLERPTFYAKVFEKLRGERGPEPTARLLSKYK